MSSSEAFQIRTHSTATAPMDPCIRTEPTATRAVQEPTARPLSPQARTQIQNIGEPEAVAGHHAAEDLSVCIMENLQR